MANKAMGPQEETSTWNRGTLWVPPVPRSAVALWKVSQWGCSDLSQAAVGGLVSLGHLLSTVAK